MKIAVCIKQVPSTETTMDWDTGTIIRNPSQMMLNSFDAFAIETAVQIKERLGGSVAAFTMGPESAENVLRESFAYGIDEGYLICDPAFAGADVFATSYTLYQAMQSIATYDIVICGQQTTDGDTAQVPPSLAEWLQVPFVSWVREMKEMHAEYVVVDVTGTQDIYTLRIQTPCLLSVEENIYDVRVPTLKGRMAARKKSVKRIDMHALADKQTKSYGLANSPTRVVEMYTPAAKASTRPKEMSGEQVLAYLTAKTDEVRGGRGV